MDNPGLDISGLSRVLSDVLGERVHGIEAQPLGESSRETPWRLDLELEAGTQRVLLRLGIGCSRNEAIALEFMKTQEIPTPDVLVWDASGERLGRPLFISEFIDGEPLLRAMRARESWALELYLDTALRLQSIPRCDIPPTILESLEVAESAEDVLHEAYRMMVSKDGLVERAYARLCEHQPERILPQFSNGDLWPENFLIQDRQLVGVIDWQHAGFSDPLFEFLLPFFLVPELRGLGLEERFCCRKGIDPSVLPWYRGLEFFDSLRWVMKTGQPYEMHTEQSLRADLERWLSES